MAIWQDLIDDHGFAARYATAPGEGQVDYGDVPMVHDRSTGKYRRTRLFVLTLGYSRKSVRLFVWRSSAHIWASCTSARAPAGWHCPRDRAR